MDCILSSNDTQPKNTHCLLRATLPYVFTDGFVLLARGRHDCSLIHFGSDYSA